MNLGYIEFYTLYKLSNLSWIENFIDNGYFHGRGQESFRRGDTFRKCRKTLLRKIAENSLF